MSLMITLAVELLLSVFLILRVRATRPWTKTYTSHRDYPIPPEIMKMLEAA